MFAATLVVVLVALGSAGCDRVQSPTEPKYPVAYLDGPGPGNGGPTPTPTPTPTPPCYPPGYVGPGIGGATDCVPVIPPVFPPAPTPTPAQPPPPGPGQGGV